MSETAPANDQGPLTEEGDMRLGMVTERKPKVVEVDEEDRHYAQQAVVVKEEEPPQPSETVKKCSLVRSGAIRGRGRKGKEGAMTIYACKLRETWW